jgi:hypothetical protein
MEVFASRGAQSFALRRTQFDAFTASGYIAAESQEGFRPSEEALGDGPLEWVIGSRSSFNFSFSGYAVVNNSNPVIIFSNGSSLNHNNHVFAFMVYSGEYHLCIWESSAWVSKVSGGVPITETRRFDIEVSIASTGGVLALRVGKNANPLLTFSGDTLGDNATFDRIVFSSSGPIYSALLASDQNTIPMTAYDRSMTANGHYHESIGSYADVAKTGIDDTTALVCTASGQTTTFNLSALPAGVLSGQIPIANIVGLRAASSDGSVVQALRVVQANETTIDERAAAHSLSISYGPAVHAFYNFNGVAFDSSTFETIQPGVQSL